LTGSDPSTNLRRPNHFLRSDPCLAGPRSEGLWREGDACADARGSDLERIDEMGLILLVLLLVLIFAGAGFALHVLWIIAVVLLLIWILGFLVSGAEHSWYRVQRK
jgi:hypothetical protein